MSTKIRLRALFALLAVPVSWWAGNAVAGRRGKRLACQIVEPESAR